LVEALQPGDLTPSRPAQRSRFRARLDATQGRDEKVEENFRAAEALFREFDLAFYLAATQLEHAEWLAAQGRGDEAEPLLDEARKTFEGLEARPWLERLGAGQPQTVTA
jgi:ATP/maltotriose-dependent transcriptional regulator MalT